MSLELLYYTCTYQHGKVGEEAPELGAVGGGVVVVLGEGVAGEDQRGQGGHALDVLQLRHTAELRGRGACCNNG